MTTSQMAVPFFIGHLVAIASEPGVPQIGCHRSNQILFHSTASNVFL